MTTPDLSDLPDSMKKLPYHLRLGVPIPIVNTFGFQDYDFTTINGPRATHLAQRKRCGICGERFEVAAFLGGPRSAETQAYTDPPMHEECAAAAIKLCPHMARKNMRRATDNHVRKDSITPENMVLAKPDRWMMYVCEEYRMFLDGPEDEQVVIYVPGDSLYLRTWEYTDQGTLEEV